MSDDDAKPLGVSISPKRWKKLNGYDAGTATGTVVEMLRKKYPDLKDCADLRTATKKAYKAGMKTQPAELTIDYSPPDVEKEMRKETEPKTPDAVKSTGSTTTPQSTAAPARTAKGSFGSSEWGIPSEES